MGKNSKINKTLTLSIIYALRKWGLERKRKMRFSSQGDVAGNFPIASDQSEEMEESCTAAC